MRRLGRAAAVLALLWLPAACVPVSEQPLSDPETAKLEPRLIGTWTATIEGELAILHVLPRNERLAELLLVSSRTAAVGPRGDWMAFTLFPSRIGDTDYANLRFVAQSGENSPDLPEGYHLARFRLGPDDTLEIWPMRAEDAKRAIRDGLGGEIKDGKWVDEIRFTATTAELRAYLEGHDPAALFTERLGTFRRWKRP